MPSLVGRNDGKSAVPVVGTCTLVMGPNCFVTLSNVIVPSVFVSAPAAPANIVNASFFPSGEKAGYAARKPAGQFVVIAVGVTVAPEGTVKSPFGVVVDPAALL